jgi:hypothetical protein
VEQRVGIAHAHVDEGVTARAVELVVGRGGNVDGDKRTGYYYTHDVGEQPARQCAKTAPCRGGLRHAHETLLLDRGIPLHVVAAMMGHDPATMLRHYAHVAPGSQRQAAGLEDLLDGEQPTLRAVPAEPVDETPDGEARRAPP